MSYLAVVTALTPGLRVRGDLSTTDDPAVNALGADLAVGARVVVDMVGKQVFVFGVLGVPARYPGEILAGGWLVAPVGTLDCLGGSFLRATYPALFAAIGTGYGSVDGTHFNTPNIPVGTYLTGGTPGATSGSATHTLTTAEMPSHNHTQDPHGHTVNLGGSGAQALAENTLDGSGPRYHLAPGSSSLSAVSTTATNNTTGGGAAFPLAPASIGVRYVIKT